MSKPATGIKGLAEGRTDLFNVDPHKLKIKQGWNSRDFNDPANIEHVDNLAQSIAAVGVKQPLTAYFEDGEAWISDGECRLRAVFKAIETYKADIKTIPVRVEDRYANEADRLLNQYIRNTGKPFSAIELSNHFKRLLGMGWQAKDIAVKAGISPARVSQILGLQTLPEPVKEMVTKGQVAATTAVALVKNEGPSEAEKQLKQGWVTAQAEGSTKVLPKHMPTVEGSPPESTVNTATLVKDAFEYSDVDTDSEDQVAIIRMPIDKWRQIAERLKL